MFIINWENVFENFLGNIFSDIIVGLLITTFVTRFFDLLTQKKAVIGSLILIEAEIQVNKQMLEVLLEDGFVVLENQMKRGTKEEVPLKKADFDDIAQFFRIITDNLLFGAFHATYVGLGNLENKTLLEKILNIYTVKYHYTLKTAFQLEQLNWNMVDGIKKKLKTEIDNSTSLSKDINSEIKKLKKRNTFKETLGIKK